MFDTCFDMLGVQMSSPSLKRLQMTGPHSPSYGTSGDRIEDLYVERPEKLVVLPFFVVNMGIISRIITWENQFSSVSWKQSFYFTYSCFQAQWDRYRCCEMPPTHNNYLTSPELIMENGTSKLRLIRLEQDFPWSSTGLFVVPHCVHGAFQRFPIQDLSF